MIARGGHHSDPDDDFEPEQDGLNPPPLLLLIPRKVVRRVPGVYQLVDHWSVTPNLCNDKRRLA
ncbi:hypothetical protein GGU11DRAFT_750732 [Lentinula aff. detonsa]|nr:hypothetical protein GGU11DRAFT_750732 [Lentinula aff. detonsa]